MGTKLDAILDSIVKLSLPKRLLMLVGILVLLSGGYYYFFWTPKQDETSRLEIKLDRLQVDLAKKQAIAERLDEFKAEVAELDAKFVRMLAQLPSRKEIPGLLSSVSGLGKETGLDFLLFKPKAEVRKDFYSEVPVDIQVFGTFHKVATFFDKVSKLSRIVNITNVSMVPTESKTKTSSGEIWLTTSCLATTFRFLEGSEESETEKAQTE